MSDERLISVAVDAPLPMALTYKSLDAHVPGSSVIVPLGKRKAHAVVLGDAKSALQHEFEIKQIESQNLERPILPQKFLQWLEWVAEYYVHPIGLVTALAFPPLDTKTSKRKSSRAPVLKDVPQSVAPELTQEQSACVQNILKDPGFATHLLHGVTGSGKTEVYLQLLEHTLKNGKRGLVLVPEISLTPQLIQRFSARFGDKIAVLHSHLTDRERTTQWWSVVDNEKQILIGARSALFCPIENLGLIILDEEHEPSYKQDEKLRYNARDAAVVMAKFLNIPIVLGSATPSLETWHNAQTGKYKLHSMPTRVGKRSLPTVEVVDLRLLKPNRAADCAQLGIDPSTLPFWLSPKLYSELKSVFENKQQSALFLNRRGVASTVLCGDCGYIYKCPNCAISLTLHGKSHLVCHYCDYSARLKETCESCHVGEPTPLGLGVEQIEDDIKKLFPEARVMRADRDEIHTRASLEELIENMESHKIDILVGTQMIAKGLDFPMLTLVGLVLADVGFNLPDFRATERSFQLITQVSGRAGRHIASGGKVIVQTYNPDHASVQFSQNLNYAAFAEHELNSRKELNYPPFGKLALIKITGKTPRVAEDTADLLRTRAEHLRTHNSLYEPIKFLGPCEAPIAKLRGQYRHQLLIKSTAGNVLSPFCRQLLSDLSWAPAGTKVQVDIDPLNML